LDELWNHFLITSDTPLGSLSCDSGNRVILMQSWARYLIGLWKLKHWTLIFRQRGRPSLHEFDYRLHLSLWGISRQCFLTLGMADGEGALVSTSVVLLVDKTLIILVHETALMIQRGGVSLWTHISLNS
jgi:hypothetical protein